VVVLDFAVQAVHVSSQHLLTMTHPDRTSSVVGGYMIFYSLGSALGATTTTAVFAGAGWTGSSILGAVLAACALVAWASSRRVAALLGLSRSASTSRSVRPTDCTPSCSGSGPSTSP
jgi:predicted MFS family arabinose efflux permease